MSEVLTRGEPPAVAAGTVPRSEIDPFGAEYLANPYPFHAALRDAGPVVWLDRYRVWAVARHAEVQAVLNDWQTFCSGRGAGFTDFARETPWRKPSVILEADPPAHTATRSVVGRILSPAGMKRLRDDFAASAERKADELVARRHVDAVHDIGEGFPLSVFPEAVGLSEEGREHLLPYGDLTFNAFGPRNERMLAALAAGKGHMDWVAWQCGRERLKPGGIGWQIYEAADAGEIDEETAGMLVRTLLSAGLDTTVHGLGSAIYCLARFPGEWDRLRADPGLARAAFEEAVRLESPIQTFFRTTTRPARIGETELGEGEKVMMSLGAANRDPRRWEDPERYDITRRVSGHVGFGFGLHMCAGQLLARLEGEVMLAALARRVARIEITGEPVFHPNNTLRGLESLPITLHPA